MAVNQEVTVHKVEKEEDTKIVVVKNAVANVKNKQPIRIIPYDEKSIIGVTKKNCKVCQSEFREEAEMMFMKQKFVNYSSVATFLQNKGEDIKWHSVRNHMIYHFRAEQKREFLQEYEADVQKWINIQPSKADSLRKRIAILERDLVFIGAEGEDLPLVERRKNSETMKKLADTLLAYESKLEEVEKTIEPVVIILNQLKIIVNDEIQNTESKETKKVIVSILERLQNEVGDIVVTQKD